MMALFFGLQSLQAYSIFGWFAELYRDAGFSAHDAGLLLGVITGVSIPLSFVIPTLAARTHNQTLLMCAVMACYPVGYLGLIFAPHAGAWLGGPRRASARATFPLILTLIGLRARTPAGTAALSGFTQSTGYLIAGDRPVRRRAAARRSPAAGRCRCSPCWCSPSPSCCVGLAVSRPAYVEDELGRP